MLHGELVTLRAFKDGDLAALNAYTNDVETELFGGGDVPTPRPLESTTALWERRRENQSSVDFIIEADGKIIGELGLFNPDVPGRTVELGITVGDKAYWGRGYGTDAVRVAVDYAFTMRNIRKVHLNVLGPNTRAITGPVAALIAIAP